MILYLTALLVGLQLGFVLAFFATQLEATHGP